MKYIEKKAEWNDYFYAWLNNHLEQYYQHKKDKKSFCNSDIHTEKYLINDNFDFESIIYKKVLDEEEQIDFAGKKYTLLPMGLVKNAIGYQFINKNQVVEGMNTEMMGTMDNIVRSEEYCIFYYPNDARKPDWRLFAKVCKSYINHYKDSLGEDWDEKDFYEMIKELHFLTVKYAKDTETNEIFAIGFFGAYIRKGANGKCLTNAELYVMPEFRKLRIAKKLVGLSFDEALKNGITDFDSITYRVPNNDALSFWESIGANTSGLYHIEGDISEMAQEIEKKVGEIENHQTPKL